MKPREQTWERLQAASPTVLPSLLLCDFGNLEREVATLEESGVAGLHLDVMDGRFVPNLTYGMPLVEAFRRLTDLPLDVHLMIEEPERLAKAFCDTGADSITFHVEACQQPGDLLTEIKALGVRAGVAINPDTPLERIVPYVAQCDLVLVMSVPAGFGGQSFRTEALDKLRNLREMRSSRTLLEVDGGINSETISQCTRAGADLVVVGSAIFRNPPYADAVRRLNDLARLRQ